MNLLVDGLAAARLTRLVTRDLVTAPVRDWAWENRHDRAYEFLTCRWCVGMWAGLGVVAARRLAPRVWGPVGESLAVAMLASTLASLVRNRSVSGGSVPRP